MDRHPVDSMNERMLERLLREMPDDALRAHVELQRTAADEAALWAPPAMVANLEDAAALAEAVLEERYSLQERDPGLIPPPAPRRISRPNGRPL